MHSIKFSHEYQKMPFHKESVFEAALLEVLIAKTEELCEGFIDYDTTYSEPMGDKVLIRKYPLSKGKVLILLLQSYGLYKNEMWTTVRRYTPEKEAYYRGLRGQQVQIVIEGRD